MKTDVLDQDTKSAESVSVTMQAARSHAVEMEEHAQEETVGAEEAYLLLGDAEVTVSPLPLHPSRLLRSQLGHAYLSNPQP